VLIEPVGQIVRTCEVEQGLGQGFELGQRQGPALFDELLGGTCVVPVVPGQFEMMR